MQQIAALLEQHKARNFSYLGFMTTKVVASRTYSFDLKDGTDTSKALTEAGAAGRSSVLNPITTNSPNYNFLVTSTGFRCKNKTAENVTYTGGGVRSEAW